MNQMEEARRQHLEEMAQRDRELSVRLFELEQRSLTASDAWTKKVTWFLIGLAVLEVGGTIAGVLIALD